MTIEDIQQICESLPGTTTDIKWEQDLCFCVGDKMYVVLGLDKKPTTASFKVPDDQFDSLLERDGFYPAPYLARYKWVALDDISKLTLEEWRVFTQQAHQLIAQKLSKSLQKKLGITD